MENRLISSGDNITFLDNVNLANSFSTSKWGGKKLVSSHICEVLDGFLPDLNIGKEKLLDELGKSGGFLNLGDLTDKLTWRDRTDLKSQVMGCLDRAQDNYLRNLSKRMSVCSNVLDFVYNSSAEQERHRWTLMGAYFCRVRGCPVCQWRKSSFWVARFHERLPLIMEDFPSHKFLLLTLTLRNVPVEELSQTLSHMQASWSRLRKLKDFPAKVGDFSGGFLKSVEVTRGQNGSAHPHFHVLLHVPATYFSKRYLTKVSWAALWQNCLRVDYEPVVDIRVVGGARAYRVNNVDSVFRGVLEVVKYETKSSSLVFYPDFLRSVLVQLKGRRSIELGGTLRDYFTLSLSQLQGEKLRGEKSILIEQHSGEDWRLTDSEIELSLSGEKQNTDLNLVRFVWDIRDKKYCLYNH